MMASPRWVFWRLGILGYAAACWVTLEASGAEPSGNVEQGRGAVRASGSGLSATNEALPAMGSGRFTMIGPASRATIKGALAAAAGSTGISRSRRPTRPDSPTAAASPLLVQHELRRCRLPLSDRQPEREFQYQSTKTPPPLDLARLVAIHPRFSRRAERGPASLPDPTLTTHSISSACPACTARSRSRPRCETRRAALRRGPDRRDPKLTGAHHGASKKRLREASARSRGE